MAQRPQPVARPAPRLYLTTPQIADPAGFLATLASALEATDVAAVLLHFAQDAESTLVKRAKAVAPLVQEKGAALILAGHPDLIAKCGADGAHLTGIDAFTDAAGALKPARIAGCGGLTTRHDAMTAAERGADYVMFGEPDDEGQRPAFDAIVDRVQWWAEVFEIPCVAYAAALDEIEKLVEAGADFVVAGDCIWSDPRGAAVAVADAARRLALPEPAR